MYSFLTRSPHAQCPAWLISRPTACSLPVAVNQRALHLSADINCVSAKPPAAETTPPPPGTDHLRAISVPAALDSPLCRWQRKTRLARGVHAIIICIEDAKSSPRTVQLVHASCQSLKSCYTHGCTVKGLLIQDDGRACHLHLPRGTSHLAISCNMYWFRR